MIIQNLNWLAVIVSALAYFALGAVWFGPVFGKMWMKGHGISQPTEEEKKNMNMGMIFGMSFLKTIVMVVLTSYIVMIINYNGNMMTALKIGAVLGGIASFPTGINYLFLKKPFSIWLLDGGYHACGVIITSVIMSVWR